MAGTLRSGAQNKATTSERFADIMRPDATQETFRMHIRGGSRALLYALARDTRADPETLSMILEENPKAYISRGVAHNPNATGKMLHRMAIRESDQDVLANITGNEAAGPLTLAYIRDKTKEHADTRWISGMASQRLAESFREAERTGGWSMEHYYVMKGWIRKTGLSEEGAIQGAVRFLVERVLKIDPRDLTLQHFMDNDVRALVKRYNNVPYRAITEAFPELKILPWEMVTTPNGVFSEPENRRSAVRWLAGELGKEPAKLTAADFLLNRLSGLMRHYYSSSPYLAVADAYPELGLKPWEMVYTPTKLFRDLEMRRAATRWLVEKLEKEPASVTMLDFYRNGLAGLINHHSNSPYRALLEAYPEMEARPWQRARTPRGYFMVRENRIEAIDWLVETLQKEAQHITSRDFRRHGLAGLLNEYYRNSPYLALLDAGRLTEEDEAYMRGKHNVDFKALLRG